jgi:hypothetical protein
LSVTLDLHSQGTEKKRIFCLEFIVWMLFDEGFCSFLLFTFPSSHGPAFYWAYAIPDGVRNVFGFLA